MQTVFPRLAPALIMILMKCLFLMVCKYKYIITTHFLAFLYFARILATHVYHVYINIAAIMSCDLSGLSDSVINLFIFIWFVRHLDICINNQVMV